MNTSKTRSIRVVSFIPRISFHPQSVSGNENAQSNADALSVTNPGTQLRRLPGRRLECPGPPVRRQQSGGRATEEPRYSGSVRCPEYRHDDYHYILLLDDHRGHHQLGDRGASDQCYHHPREPIRQHHGAGSVAHSGRGRFQVRLRRDSVYNQREESLHRFDNRGYRKRH